MKKYIPWIIAGFLLLSSAFTTYLLLISDTKSEEGSNQSTEALDQITPHDMRTSNVTSSSFTVTWTTKVKSTGFLKYGNTSNSISLIAQDVNGTEPRIDHKVVVSGLTAGKKYYFYVMSDGVAFGIDGRALEVLTSSGL